ncbi:hypothetical protein D3C86_1570560 [compost metagenome]
MPSSRARACSVSLAAISGSDNWTLVALINRARTCTLASSALSLATSVNVWLTSTRVRASRPRSPALLTSAWARPRLFSGSLKRENCPWLTAWR